MKGLSRNNFPIFRRRTTKNSAEVLASLVRSGAPAVRSLRELALRAPAGSECGVRKTKGVKSDDRSSLVFVVYRLWSVV